MMWLNSTNQIQFLCQVVFGMLETKRENISGDDYDDDDEDDDD